GTAGSSHRPRPTPAPPSDFVPSWHCSAGHAIDVFVSTLAPVPASSQPLHHPSVSQDIAHHCVGRVAHRQDLLLVHAALHIRLVRKHQQTGPRKPLFSLHVSICFPHRMALGMVRTSSWSSPCS